MSVQPTNKIERLFVRHATKRLPLLSANVIRNAYGLLIFEWKSPSENIGSLFVSICAREVVLSCNISHSHVSNSNYLKHKRPISNLHMKRLIAKDAVTQAMHFLNGDIYVSKLQRTDETVIAYGWSQKDVPNTTKQFLEKIGEKGTSEYIWNWFGKIEN